MAEKPLRLNSVKNKRGMIRMRGKLKKIASILCALVILACCSPAGYAHSGRTDGQGGHRDNRNASGLGSYHYHHGYSAHLHPNGYCPYTDVFPSKVSISAGKTTLGYGEECSVSAAVSLPIPVAQA